MDSAEAIASGFLEGLTENLAVVGKLDEEEADRLGRRAAAEVVLQRGGPTLSEIASIRRQLRSFWGLPGRLWRSARRAVRCLA